MLLTWELHRSPVSWQAGEQLGEGAAAAAALELYYSQLAWFSQLACLLASEVSSAVCLAVIAGYM
jgi:hypothetical protein